MKITKIKINQWKELLERSNSKCEIKENRVKNKIKELNNSSFLSVDRV